MPVFEQNLTASCYACRAGKGVHQAVRCYRRGARRYRYALKLDISAYFPSIDHRILQHQLAQLFDDERVLTLFERIIESAPYRQLPPLWQGADLIDLALSRTGLPIGNLTSQHMGNLYLADVDRFIRNELKIPVYLRYVDDLVLLHDSKQVLWQAFVELENKFANLHLCIHPRKIILSPTRAGLDVLGYRVYPHKVRLRRDNGYRFRRHLKAAARQLACGRKEFSDIGQSVAAWNGHCRHADAKTLQKAILDEVVFTKGCVPSDHPAGAARWRLEQQTREPPLSQP